MDNENQPQTMKQKLMIVSSQYSDVVIELIKGCVEQKSLVGENEYSTIVNAVTFDVQSEMLTKVINTMNDIKNGSLFEQQ